MSGSEYSPPSGYAWLAGWYATRLHAVKDGAFECSDGIQSVCGAWVYRAPRTEWAAKNMQLGIPRCKHCERILSQNDKHEWRLEVKP